YCALFLHCSLLPPLLPFPYTPPFRSEQAGLAASFDVIVDSHFEGVEKPHPEIFRRALARLGVTAAAAAFVGDIWSIDVEGSRAAGLRPILLDVTGGYADRECERIAPLAELRERLGLAAQEAKR